MNTSVHKAGKGILLPGRRWLIGLSLFSAISALGGGIELIVWHAGNPHLPPLGILKHTPFGDFGVPGLILASIVGGTSLIAAYSAWRRTRSAVDLTLLAGGTLTLWIFSEVAMLRSVHWLHGVYAAVGLGILGLALRAAKHSEDARLRWIVFVTVAEAVGFLVPMSVGISLSGSTMQGLGALIIGAGLIEGLALGVGQAWALPFRVNRWRYATLTALGAGIAWGSAMTAAWVASLELPRARIISVAVVAALIGLFAIGGAQYLELQRHRPNALGWISWTALAWVLALPASFAPGPFVDASTPLWASYVLFGAGGVLMAYVMARITWHGVQHLLSTPTDSSQAGQRKPGAARGPSRLQTSPNRAQTAHSLSHIRQPL